MRFDRTAYKYLTVAFLAFVSAIVISKAQPQQKLPPGLHSFSPRRIDWLVTTLQASLRDDEMQTKSFQLEITSPDPETILVYVRYLPDVDRAVMNSEIDTARQVIEITAKSYGWENWVKVREDVQPAKPSVQQ